MKDKEQHDMQICKRTKHRPRAIQYSHQSKHFDHGFAHNSSHKHCKESNQQSTKHHKAKVKIRWRGHLLEWDERNAKKMKQKCTKEA